MEAHGTYGGQVRFRRGRGGVHVYSGGEPHSKSPKRVTAGQQAQRDRYRGAVDAWNALTGSAKQAWQTAGVSRGISGFSAYISAELGGAAGASLLSGWPAGGLTVEMASGSVEPVPTTITVEV